LRERDTRVEADTCVAELSRLRDDSGQSFLCGIPGSGIADIFFCILDVAPSKLSGLGGAFIMRE
jgi:hypothetical protein